MEIPKEVWAAAIGATPALLALFVTWLLENRGTSRRLKHVTELEKRVQVIEKILALGNPLTADFQKRLRDELTEIGQDLFANRDQERTAGKTSVERLGRLRRWLLFYPQPSLSAHIYRVLYWFFLSVSLLIALAIVLTLFGGQKSPESYWILPALLFYPFIAYLFYAAARRQQRRAQAMAARSVNT